MEPDRPPHPPGKDTHLCEGALQLFLAQSVSKSALNLERLWNLTSPHPPGKDTHLCEGALQLFLAQSVSKSALVLERLWNLTRPFILQVKMLICMACCSSSWRSQ
jgi:hypothetical protein